MDGFNPNAQSGSVSALCLQPDNSVLAGGYFTGLGGLPRAGLGRVHSDGTPDLDFDPGGNGNVNTISIQTDRRVLVGGSFTTLGGRPCTNLARLMPNGTADPDFNSVTDGFVAALVLQSDDKILVGGNFTQLGGQPQPHTIIGRLNPNGTVDTTFAPVAAGYTVSIALQHDGKILIGGSFTSPAGQACTNIGRLLEDGTWDSAFHAAANSLVACMVVQTDGRIIVGGPFTNLNGQARNYLGRLNTDGTLDPGFNPNPDNPVVCLASQSDGKLLVSGAFTHVADHLLTCLARLNADGSLDTNFNPGPITIAPGMGPVAVNAGHLQPDGKIVVAGTFTALAGQPRGAIGRYSNTDLATQSLSINNSNITWLRGGTSPEVWRTTFEASGDGVNWANLGSGTRITGGWQLTSVSVPLDATVRARGFVNERGRCWFTETLSRPSILVSDGNLGFRSNRFGFNISASAGQRVVVEGSTNQVNWTRLATNTMGLDAVYFSDPGAANLPHRFYRVGFK